MPFGEGLRLAFQAIWGHKLRSFFTLLGIMVSVGFLVAVVAIIDGMNAYVQENLASAIVGANSFQVRQRPFALGLARLDDLVWRQYERNPEIGLDEYEWVREAIPDARAVSLRTGTSPNVDVAWRSQTLRNVNIVGITPPYQIVQDYVIDAGEPLTDVDIRFDRRVALLGWDVAEELFGDGERAVGQDIRIDGRRFRVKGVAAPKGSVIGQSLDAFVLIPYTVHGILWGRPASHIISVKVESANAMVGAMDRAEEAMRVAHRLRPAEPNDFSVQTGDVLVAFWTNLTRVLFAVVPAVVTIGVIVGGIVIMNIMLMSVTERTREVGLRKTVGATRADVRRQFLAESVVLAVLGGVMGLAGGAVLAGLVAAVSPLPTRVTPWSAATALTLGAVVGIVFGVYPAARAARLDPVEALRAE